MAEVKERNTEERATRMAERIWRETIDDSKLDIKRIRAICLFYLIAERDQAVASHAPATAGPDSQCKKCGAQMMRITVGMNYACRNCQPELFKLADSPAPSAPATGKLSNSGLSGYIRVPAPEPTATQSGASATHGDLIREVEICEQNCSAWIPCKTQDVRSLLAEVETLKAERDSWREVCNQILTLRGKNKELERTVTELRAREGE